MYGTSTGELKIVIPAGSSRNCPRLRSQDVLRNPTGKFEFRIHKRTPLYFLFQSTWKEFVILPGLLQEMMYRGPVLRHQVVDHCQGDIHLRFLDTCMLLQILYGWSRR